MKKVVLSAAAFAMAFSSANADVMVDEYVIAEAVEASVFDSIYAGAGLGGNFLKASPTAEFKHDWSFEDLGNMKKNRLMGSVVLGGGKVLKNKVYVGGEVLFDMMKNKEETFKTGNTEVFLKANGLVTQFAGKVGYTSQKNVLVYGKVACALSRVKVNAKAAGKDELDKSKTGASFVLGLGAEKAFCNKFSTALEVDYNFGFKAEKVRFNRGWNVRALVKYNVKY
jgi:opacity protein-like surface antigen